MKTYEKLRDRVLEQDARDVVRHDERLRGVDVDVRLDGGVAHVDGRVCSAEDARLLRRALARVAGINAVWDFVHHPGQDRLEVVDVGCGGTKQRSSAFGIDRRPVQGVDVVCDLEHGLPLASGSVDHVFAVHVLEHVANVRAFEPVALTTTDDTVFADLEPVQGDHSVPYDAVVARFFT